MRLEPECFPCGMRQAVAAARLAGVEGEDMFELLKRAAAIISEVDHDEPPPVMGEDIYTMVGEVTGTADPFAELKREENRLAKEMLPEIRMMVEESGDPFRAAVKVSIAGNAMDPGAQESYDVVESVRAALSEEGALRSYPSLLEDLEGADTVLFIADNCGEVVLDTLLIEMIRERFGPEVILAVKESPVLNDVTVDDAEELGLGELCPVMSTGLKMPGTVLGRTSPGFRKAFDRADVVIAKGQGNWETLEDCDRKVYFLFQAKCNPVARVNDCRRGENLLLSSR